MRNQLTFSGDILMLESADGNAIWRASFNTPSLYPAMVDRRLLLGEMDGTLRALDPVSGKTAWQKMLPSRLVAPVSGNRGCYWLPSMVSAISLSSNVTMAVRV